MKQWVEENFKLASLSLSLILVIIGIVGLFRGIESPINIKLPPMEDLVIWIPALLVFGLLLVILRIGMQQRRKVRDNTLITSVGTKNFSELDILTEQIKRLQTQVDITRRHAMNNFKIIKQLVYKGRSYGGGQEDLLRDAGLIDAELEQFVASGHCEVPNMAT